MPLEALRRPGVVAAATAAIVVAIGLAILASRNVIHIPFDWRTVLILMIAGAFLIAASRVFFSGGESVTPVRYVVAFDAVVFVVLGYAATVLACSQWEIAALLAGASLMIGGFIGLLFGYPQGLAQQAAATQNLAQQSNGANAGGAAGAGAGQQANANAGGADGGQAADAQLPAAPVAPSTAPLHAQNLVAESAATLGKVIAGFTLAKMEGIGRFFWNLTDHIGPSLGAIVTDATKIAPGGATPGQVLAGVIIAYFAATGFLCGLFLPPYFMSEVI